MAKESQHGDAVSSDRPDSSAPSPDKNSPSPSTGTGQTRGTIYGHRHPYYSQAPYYGSAYGGYYGGSTYGYGAPYYGAPYGAPYYGVPYYGAPRSEEEEEESALGSLDPSRILRVCLKKLPVVLNIIVLSGIAAWAYYQALPITYEATALIEMSVRGRRVMPTTLSPSEENVSGSSVDEVFNTRLTKLKSREVQAQVMARFRRDNPKIQITDEELEEAIENVSLTLRRRTRLVEITARTGRPELSAALVNTYAETAVQNAADENRSFSESAVFWLRSQAEQQRRVLEKADQAIVDFRTQSQLDNLISQRQAVEVALASYNSELVRVENELARAVDLMAALQAAQANPDAIASLPESLPRAGEIAAVIQRLQTALADRDALLVRYTEQHPTVIEKNKQIEAIREQFKEAARRTQETASATLDLLRKQVDTLRWKKEEQLKLAADLDLRIKSIQMKLEQLEREKEAHMLSYRGILNRIEEARLALDEAMTTVMIVEKAEPPQRPLSRGLPQIMIIGLFLGTLVGVGVALMLDKLEDKIIGPADIELRMRLKVLALLPHVAKTTREQLALTVAQKKFSRITEVFAGLRALLESPRYQEVNRCVLIISTQPEEGKTITVCNLALAYAQSGLKTLLVDFDLRRPRLGRIFQVEEKAKASLLHVLQQGDPSQFENLPTPTAFENLHVVPSQVAENISPADVMGRPTVKEFVEWAKSRYERVIIDSPPFGVVSDPVVLGQVAGAVIIVSRLGRSRYHPVVHAVREFRHAGCKVIGVILNDVPYRGESYSHYDYRRY